MTVEKIGTHINSEYRGPIHTHYICIRKIRKTVSPAQKIFSIWVPVLSFFPGNDTMKGKGWKEDGRTTGGKHITAKVAQGSQIETRRWRNGRGFAGMCLAMEQYGMIRYGVMENKRTAAQEEEWDESHIGNWRKARNIIKPTRHEEHRGERRHASRTAEQEEKEDHGTCEQSQTWAFQEGEIRAGEARGKASTRRCSLWGERRGTSNLVTVFHKEDYGQGSVKRETDETKWIK